MKFSSLPALAVLCLTSIGSLLQAQTAAPVSQLFALGGNSSGSQIAAYPATATGFGSVQTFNGPSSPYLILPTNQRYYVLANTGLTGVLSVDLQFQNARTVGSLASPPSVGAVSPDQRRLIVGAGNIFLFDISGQQETILSNTGIPVTGSIIDITVSLDSSRAFVLTRSATASFVYAITLSNGSLATASPLQLPGGATGITVGPAGWLYVSAINRLYEINGGGTTLAIRSGGEIGLVGSPNKPVFTPDGRFAIMTNTTPLIGNVSMYLVDLVSRGTPLVFPPSGVANNVPTIDRVLVVNNNRFLVFSSQATAIFEGTINPFNLLDAQSLSLVTNIRNVTAAAISNEVPQAKYLYLIVSNQQQSILQRLDLTNNTLAGQAGLLSANLQLQFGYVPTTVNPANVQQINDSQVLSAGSTSVPLIIRVTDSAGRPVSGAPVQFTTGSTATIGNPSVSTSNAGFAQTVVTAPSTPGPFTISAAVGGITAPVNFSLSVPGGGGGGGGGPTNGGIFIYSGNGQLAIELSTGQQPLIVQIKDAQGRPVPNETVTWQVSQGNVGIRDISSTTDADGLAQTNYGTASINPGFAFTQSIINASSAFGSVDFVTTTALRFLIGGGSAPNPILELYAPTLDTNRTITLPAGGTGIGVIVTHAAALAPPQAGAAIPNIGTRVALLDSSGGTSCPAGTFKTTDFNGLVSCNLSCANSAVPLTDSTGTGTCDLVAPCKLGFSNINIYVGEFGYFSGGIVVTPGKAGRIQVLTGNNQSGTAGQTLPLSFLAIVQDGCGTPLSGQTVVWKVATGNGTLTRVVSTSDAAGRVSAQLTLGTTSGATTVTVTAGTVVATYTATVNVTVTTVTAVSGGGQTVNINSTFSQPLVVQVNDAQGRPVTNFPVVFAITSGNGAVTPATVNTDSNGRATANVTAGPTAGNINVTATAAGIVASFSLTARLPGPAVTPAGFQNSASFQAGLTPCALSTVTGTGLAPAVQGVLLGNQFFGPLPTSFQGTQITINGIPAPIYYVSNINGKEQVAFQTPCEATPSTNATAVITVNGASSTITGVLISIYQPGIFQYTASNNVIYAVAQREDGSYVAPDNPARRGDKIRLYVTGLGQATPTLITNRPGVNDQIVTASIVVGINGAGTNVISAQTLPGSVGVYTVVFQVPDNAPIADTKVIVAVGLPNDGGLVFGPETTLPIR